MFNEDTLHEAASDAYQNYSATWFLRTVTSTLKVAVLENRFSNNTPPEYYLDRRYLKLALIKINYVLAIIFTISYNFIFNRIFLLSTYR